jgi:hypothetical protein
MKYLVIATSLLVLAGCNMKAALEKQSAKAEQVRAQKPVPAPPPKKVEPERKKGIIGKMTDDIEDYKVAMAENPKLVEVELKSGGDDYITFMASAYINVRARASMLGMEAALKQFKYVEERNPTYAEMMKMIKENHIEFAQLPAYRRYTYDAKRGVFIILEDPELKATMHDEKK